MKRDQLNSQLKAPLKTYTAVELASNGKEARVRQRGVLNLDAESNDILLLK